MFWPSWNRICLEPWLPIPSPTMDKSFYKVPSIPPPSLPRHLSCSASCGFHHERHVRGMFVNESSSPAHVKREVSSFQLLQWPKGFKNVVCWVAWLGHSTVRSRAPLKIKRASSLFGCYFVSTSDQPMRIRKHYKLINGTNIQRNRLICFMRSFYLWRK